MLRSPRIYLGVGIYIYSRALCIDPSNITPTRVHRVVTLTVCIHKQLVDKKQTNKFVSQFCIGTKNIYDW